MDRELLEATALVEVCACLHYELADSIDLASDDELLSIVNHEVPCDCEGGRL